MLDWCSLSYPSHTKKNYLNYTKLGVKPPHRRRSIYRLVIYYICIHTFYKMTNARSTLRYTIIINKSLPTFAYSKRGL